MISSLFFGPLKREVSLTAAIGNLHSWNQDWRVSDTTATVPHDSDWRVSDDTATVLRESDVSPFLLGGPKFCVTSM